jgi:hypothetical protein
MMILLRVMTDLNRKALDANRIKNFEQDLLAAA